MTQAAAGGSVSRDSAPEGVVAVVIPAYNEADRIADTVAAAADAPLG